MTNPIDKLERADGPDLEWLIDEIDRADSNVEFGALALIAQDYCAALRAGRLIMKDEAHDR